MQAAYLYECGVSLISSEAGRGGGEAGGGGEGGGGEEAHKSHTRSAQPAATWRSLAEGASAARVLGGVAAGAVRASAHASAPPPPRSVTPPPPQSADASAPMCDAAAERDLRMHVQRLATNACGKETCGKETCGKEASLLAAGANSLTCSRMLTYADVC